MKTEPGLLVVGAGISALVTVAYAALAGVRVVHVRPYLDVDGLPRPLPPFAHPGWHRFWTTLGIGLQLDVFGGLADSALSRRVLVEDDARGTIEPQSGRFIAGHANSEWSWSEPQDWLQFFKAFDVRCRALSAMTVQLKQPVQWRFRWRRFSVEGVPGWFSRACTFRTDGWYIGHNAPVLPRCASEGDIFWWMDRGRRMTHFSKHPGRVKYHPAGRPEFVHCVGQVNGTSVWGTSSNRTGMAVVGLPSPAAEPASMWFTNIAHVLGDLVGTPPAG